MGKFLVLVQKTILLFKFWLISGFEDIPKLDIKCCKVYKLWNTMIQNEQAPNCCNILGLQIAVTTFQSQDCCKHRYQGGTCSYSNPDPNKKGTPAKIFQSTDCCKTRHPFTIIVLTLVRFYCKVARIIKKLFRYSSFMKITTNQTDRQLNRDIDPGSLLHVLYRLLNYLSVVPAKQMVPKKEIVMYFLGGNIKPQPYACLALKNK